MSDAYYRERAARRTRLWLAVGGLLVLAALAVLVVRALFYDACTGSFERSPRAIVTTFVEAVRRGDAPVAQECWDHHTYYDLGAGCSEICLARVYGARFEIVDVTVGEPQAMPDGRDNLETSVSIVCAESGESHTAEITLDSVGASVPWKHWAIVRSTFGGTVAEPWCK